ncbi:MAG: AAA family ATPase [Bradymonadia bacterium]
MSEAMALVQRLRQRLSAVILGKTEVIDLALVAILARGHILLEDVPGVGKTTLAHAMAQALGCQFRRIQFTSDLLPADITGVSIFDQSSSTFEFKRGPIFAQIVLADEINRTTPKTQSSLLEAMNERQVSVDNTTYPLPSPFLVIATQNPLDHQGTYTLPESQLDRFLVRLKLGYPALAVERDILKGRGGLRADVEALTDGEGVLALQAAVDAIKVEDVVIDYLLAIVQGTRNSPQLSLGVSTRGAQALLQAVKARALLEGRGYAIPDDVKRLAVPVLAHRVQRLGGADHLQGQVDEAAQLIESLVAQVPVPL